MSDTNKNNQIDPDEAEKTVEEEGTVNEAYLEDKINEKDIKQIDSLDDLSTEAEKIKMESGMGTPGIVSEIKAEDIKVEVPEEEKAKPEEQPQPVTPPTPPEAVQEIVREQAEEIKKEVLPESEISSELKKV